MSSTGDFLKGKTVKIRCGPAIVSGESSFIYATVKFFDGKAKRRYDP